jgi:hypothetical protein
MFNRTCSLILLCVSLALASLYSVPLAAQEFSGEIVQTGKDEANRPATKVFVGKDKMRFENGGASEDAGAIILDYANQKTYILMPTQKVYMEADAGQMGLHKLNDWMRPIDPNNACPAFQAVAGDKQVTSCRKIGTESVNGRTAIKYEGTTQEDGTGYAWIDPKLHFILKWQGKDDAGELRNIKEGPQSASLFTVPAGYQKFDINAMRNQRKQNH